MFMPTRRRHNAPWGDGMTDYNVSIDVSVSTDDPASVEKLTNGTVAHAYRQGTDGLNITSVHARITAKNGTDDTLLLRLAMAYREIRTARALYQSQHDPADQIITAITDINRELNALSNVAHKDVYRARKLCDSPDKAPYPVCEICPNWAMALDGAPMCALTCRSLRGPEQ